jgi:hypothetical protein
MIANNRITYCAGSQSNKNTALPLRSSHFLPL